MNIKDYAKDVNLSVAEVLRKCDELGIKADGNSILSDDDIIMIDNTINLISTDKETTYEEEDQIDDVVEKVLQSENIVKKDMVANSKQKLKKKDSSNADFKNLKKQMYKSKSKLMSNVKEDNIVLYEEGMSVKAFADALGVSLNDIIKKLMSLGLMLSMNEVIDFENAEIVALDYNKTLKKKESQDIADFDHYEVIDDEKDLKERPAIVTIMGHVDHGKTTLLDYIRSTRVAEGEAGGITQAIGAYQTEKDGHKITFIDTPGHAAFTQMRARGASVTDIVVIIVAADDGVMPQTKEAIDHAKSAGVPIIVAVNKIDKPNINIERVYTEMSENGITPESWGGEYPFINLSAKTGEGVDTLLETILAIAEVKELKANPNRYALGAVIEEKLDKNVGGLSSFLILNGTLRLGDPVVVGTTYGKVRTMKNDKGESIVEAGPSTPVEITGLNDTPKAGDKFMAFETIEEAKEVAEKRKNIEKEKSNVKKTLSLDELFESVNAGQKEVAVVLKADVRGSEEAVKSALENIKVKDVRVKVIRSGIGPISESDIVLASASKAIVIGFNVVSSSDAKAMAKEYGIEIRCYTIIYKLVEDVEAALNGMLDPEYEEKIIGSAVVRQIFKFSKVGNIAGVYVTDGIVKNNANVRVIRDGKILIDTKISSIQRGKDQAKEVKKGFECGITLEKYDDFKEGDTFEVYVMEQVKHA
ncbi:translation initiation factor IF-2 [Mycoplasma sp. CAG:472]|jgi:translation initiation factor IF-2|nr:translation initiation factor IF-2 [Mycoplasma sp. CAG:472]